VSLNFGKIVVTVYCTFERHQLYVIYPVLQSSWFGPLDDIHLYVQSLNLCSTEYFSTMHRCIVWKPSNQFTR